MAFVYENNEMKSLGWLPGGYTSRAYDINNSGQIVGESDTNGWRDEHAFLYEMYAGDQMKDMNDPDNPDLVLSWAYAINEKGQAVGDGSSGLFLYENGQVKGLSSFFPQTSWPAAYDINYSGQIVGRYNPSTSAPLHAFILTPSTTSTDATPPTVSLTAPAEGSTVSGQSVTLSADATDNVGVTRVDFYVNGSLVGGDTTAGGTSGKEYSYTWDSKTVTDGPANIEARAYDDAGHETISSSRSVTIDNTGDPPPPPEDSTPPTVSLTAPADGAITRGASVTLSAEATDNAEVTKVEFLVDGEVVGEDTTAGGTSGNEYSVTWDSKSITDGKSIITARAYDSSNNAHTSRGIVVDNTYPDTRITSGPAEGSTTTETTARFEFDDPSVERDVTFRCKLDNGPVETCTSPKSYPNLSSGAHTFQVYAVGAGGEAEDSDPSPLIRRWTVQTSPPSDTTSPTVTNTNPAAGARNIPLATLNQSGVVATFSEKMNPDTLNKDTVKLERITKKKKKVNATPVTLSEVTLGQDGKTLTIEPAAPFAKKGVYRATITTGAEDEAGNALAQEKVWQFAMAKK